MCTFKAKMKKFTFKGVLDGFRSSIQSQMAKQEDDFQKQFRPDNFTLKRTFRHGFPYSPTTFAFDPVQRLLAVGNKSGFVQILGQPGVDKHILHEGKPGCSIVHVEFLINEGAIITVTSDDTLHLWDIRNKTPKIIQSLKFQKERIKCLHLPVGSKWLYVGTEKGNVHVVHIATFALSGYVINWNKSIELIRTTHPGAVISLCDNPTDSNKLLVAFECGLFVLWNMKGKYAETRWQSLEPIKSVAWHFEGRYFISSHSDGSICYWPTNSNSKPQTCIFPHGKTFKEGTAEKCTPIHKVDLKTNRLCETFTIFSGGLPPDKGPKSNCITVMIEKSTTVLEMEHNIIDFITLCESPWSSETQEPYAIAVLLENDLVVIDLLTPGFPCFEAPYSMDLHESAVTCCTYLTDCPSDLVPAFYSVGRSTVNKKTGFSKRDWPISGGQWSPVSCSYSEIVITGHQDGSLKFWDSSAGGLQILYKLKTAKIFEKVKRPPSETSLDNPLAVEIVALCPESRIMCIAAAQGHVLLFKFSKIETISEILMLQIPILYENFDGFYGLSPENETIPPIVTETNDNEKIGNVLKVKTGALRKPPGFQSQLVCYTTGPNRIAVQITALCINSFYGLMAYGTESGMVIIDIIQKVCLFSIASPDLYGAQDPYCRIPKSPKRNENNEEQSRSPSSDKINESTTGSSATNFNNKLGLGGLSDRRINKINEANTVESEYNIDTCVGNTIVSSHEQTSATRPPFLEVQSDIENALGIFNDVATKQADIKQYSIQESQHSSVLHESVHKSKSQDKIEGPFSRSRSSSLSSIEISSSESVTCLAIIECNTRRNETALTLPNLWIGTSFGSVLTLLITIPERNARKSQPVLVTINGGPIFRLKGSISLMSFLDGLGSVIPYTFELWKEDSREEKKERTTIFQSTSAISSSHGGGICSEACGDINSSALQLSCKKHVVIVSAKQMKVFDITSPNCVNKVQLPEMEFIVKAETVSIKDGSCLATYISNGHIIVYSLPNLKVLLNIDFLPLMDLSFQTKCKQGIVDPMLSIWGQQFIVNEDSNQISKIFCFSNKGHGLYLASPTEIQKFSISSEFCQFLPEMMTELFIPQVMPVLPKEGFLKGLFGGGTKGLDREELFGEQSGKANRSVATYIPSTDIQQLQEGASTATSEISRAHQLVLERGEKLNLLEERAERMASQAQDFSGTTHQLMLKYKDKKWYQL